MTDADLFAFMAVFNTMTKVFPFRADGDEARDISRAYFKTLQKFPLDQVRIGADNCIASMEKFPKPAEWAKRIPRRMPGPELTRLTPAEESEFRQAEKLGYEGECCTCTMCRELGADTLKTRFVPNDPDERALMGDRQVLRGHWIHGDDLLRWYAAKDAFWSLFHRTLGDKVMVGKPQLRLSAQERVEAIFAKRSHAELIEREPGEEG